MRIQRNIVAALIASIAATGAASAAELTGTLKKIKDSGAMTLGHRVAEHRGLGDGAEARPPPEVGAGVGGPEVAHVRHEPGLGILAGGRPAHQQGVAPTFASILR